MAIEIELPIVELLCSRICHDLVSPVGAINNGIELINEKPNKAECEDELALIAYSADQAARKLRMFRLAYGAGGGGAGTGFDVVKSAAETFFQGSKIKFVWGGGDLDSKNNHRTGSPKLLCNMIMLAEELLIHGGTISVEALTDASNLISYMKVSATGRAACLKAESHKALIGEAKTEELTPRTVHAFLMGLWARHLNWSVEVSPKESEAVVIEAKYGAS